MRQIEYYLSDENLKRDKFFAEKIQKSQEGWVPISDFLNCNKIKNLKAKQADIQNAVKESEEVELSEDKKSIRRVNNKVLPERAKDEGKPGLRKRDAKAQGKEEKKG